MEKQNLVLLHGWGMNSRIWDGLDDELHDRSNIFRVELPDPGEVRANAAYLNQYLDAVLVAAPERAHWLGWSLGGMLVASLAARNPERVESLVLIATNAVFASKDDWPDAMPPDTFNTFRQRFKKSPQRTFQEFVSLQFLGVERGKRYAKKLLEISAPQQMSSEILGSGLELLAVLDCREVLRQLKLPVQMINGGQDRITPVASVAAIQDLNPAFEVEIIENAGHAPFICHQDQVCRAIRQFILPRDF